MTRRPEDQLLIACVRRSVAASDVDTVSSLVTSGLDWGYLIHTATRHQVLPLLHRTLLASNGAAGTMPAAARAALQRQLDARLARSRTLTSELVRLLRLAADANLAMLPFKGPTLAAGVYGDLSLRQFADLDLLVDSSETATSEAFLRSLGYRLQTDYGWAVDFVHPETGVRVDLHRGSLSRAQFPVALVFSRLWARREPVWIEGERVETLSRDDVLLVLCIQAARDAWSGKTKLGKISDIAHVLRAGDHIDWARVTREARALHVRRMVEFGIHLAERIAQINVASRLRVSPHRVIAALVEQEERALFGDPETPAASRVLGRLLHFQLRERWRDKLHPYRKGALAMMIPTARDREALRLPPALSWLHYLLRPIHVIRRYGRYLVYGRLR